jgi:protein SCO1
MKFFGRSIWIYTAILITLPLLVFGIIHWYQREFDKLPILGGEDLAENHLPVQHTVGNFEFINQDGKIFSSKDRRNKIMVINFFFTSCPGICLDMMRHVKQVENHFLADRNVIFISFTVDPGRDNVDMLKRYANLNQINTVNWDLLTGNKLEIYKLARKSFYLPAGDGDGGENDFIHSEQIVLVDQFKHIRGYYKGTNDQAMELLKQDIKKIEYEY